MNIREGARRIYLVLTVVVGVTVFVGNVSSLPTASDIDWDTGYALRIQAEASPGGPGTNAHAQPWRYAAVRQLPYAEIVRYVCAPGASTAEAAICAAGNTAKLSLPERQALHILISAGWAMLISALLFALGWIVSGFTASRQPLP